MVHFALCGAFRCAALLHSINAILSPQIQKDSKVLEDMLHKQNKNKSKLILLIRQFASSLSFACEALFHVAAPQRPGNTVRSRATL